MGVRVGLDVLRQAEVDDILNVGDGERALGNVGGENNLPRVGGWCVVDSLLFLPGDAGVQRDTPPVKFR